MKPFLFIFVWFFADFASAQTIRNYDAQPRIELLGSNVIPPGTVRLAKAIFISNGPANYPFRSSVETFYIFAEGRQTLAIVPVPETAPCDIFYQDLGPLILLGILGPGNGPVPPGTRVECIAGIVTFPDSPVRFTQTFSASYLDDFNPANNLFDVVIRTQEAEPVQVTAISTKAAIALAAACLLFGMMVSRKVVQ